MKQLYTRWGKNLDCKNILQEYPRPLLQRESYINLNGLWEYAFTADFIKPKSYDGEILVPFSPECALSGVERQLQPEEYLWYRRKFSADRGSDNKKRLILHFGAVDQACVVYINGKRALRHTGGYLPFSVDITEYLTEEGLGEQEIVMAVKDLSDTSYHARGKQKLKRGGMFYTAQSGIWQTVWMEYVPEDSIEEILTEPDLDHKNVRIYVRSGRECPVEIRIRHPGLYWEEAGSPDKPKAHDSGGDREFGSFEQAVSKKKEPDLVYMQGVSNQWIECPLPVVKPWTCEEPYLYYFTVFMTGACAGQTVQSQNSKAENSSDVCERAAEAKWQTDRAESYFALRTFTIEKDQEGIPRICLNHQVQFQNGILDQGYWPDGLYTAPSDEAFIFDILEMKRMGFNMIRKHIKIEPQRWYYHCDRLGMVVWQDMVNGGSAYQHWFVTYLANFMSWRRISCKDTHLRLLSRTHREGRLEFIREMKETIKCLRNHPSIAVWVIFNEGWGQFQTEDMTRLVREADASRLIDSASGWFDQKSGDFQSVHNYFFPLRTEAEETRAVVLSEFGGCAYQVPEHCAYDKLYGYGTHKTIKGLNKDFRERMEKVRAEIPKGLCASIYTQISDVEEEVNGIFTYDREVKKIESE